jgi:hypothetical protein
MTSSRAYHPSFIFLLAAAALAFFAGCSYLLPVRRGSTRSFEIVIDSRRVASPALAGCFIPATFPAITKLPIAMIDKLPPGAKFTGVKAEVILKNETGDQLAMLEPSIENNHVYLKFAVPKIDANTQTHVVVTAKYDYR